MTARASSGHRRPSATGFEFTSIPDWEDQSPTERKRYSFFQSDFSLGHSVQLTANDAISVSTESLINTPYDFRWYLRWVSHPAPCSGAPCVSELYDSLADVALGKVSQNIPHRPEDAGMASKSHIESYRGIGTDRVGMAPENSRTLS
jgi:hypothetical protein